MLHIDRKVKPMSLFETISEIFSTLANGVADIYGAVIGSIAGEDVLN